MKFTESISFYILDFMREDKRQDLCIFFESVIRTVDQNLATPRQFFPLPVNNTGVRKADILIFAGEMKGRYLSSAWKTFFDRAYFWNHTPSLKSKQIAYIISGPVRQNTNLKQILEGNVTARQMANLVDIVSDEAADSHTIDSVLHRLATQVVNYSERGFIRPDNFLSVGGHKIFRDEIYGHIRGVWQADHRQYRKNGMYDFEQKKIGMRVMNFFLLSG